MDEHESNLRDLYAGFAMLGLVMRGADDEFIPHRARDFADHRIANRDSNQEEAHAAIKKEKRPVRHKAPDTDLRETPLSDV